MKPLVTLLVFLTLATSGFSQSMNMTLEWTWDDNSLQTSSDGLAFNDCWGYNAPDGTEVAILGAYQRIYFFDVTNVTSPVIIDYFIVQNNDGMTNSSIWRDFKTYDHYAYASADQGTSGLLIFDLQYAPDSIVLVDQTQEFWLKTHNIWIDVDHARLYAAGPNSNLSGTIVLDLSDPEDPVEIGDPVFPLGYIHDIHVVDNIAYASHGNDQALTIYDFTNPDDPVEIRTLGDYPEPGYNHSAWLDASGNRLVFADEAHGADLKVVNPNLDEHQTTNYHLFHSQLIENNPNSIAHNPFIKGDLCYIAYYHDGVQIFDISDTNNIERVAYYDTYSNTNYAGYEGCWGVYPYLESGTIIASDIENGLFVLSLSDDILPLDFISFNASRKANDVLLKWKVTTPDDGETFIVEHSTDGIAFEKLVELSAQKHQLIYENLHPDPGPGNHFYRIVVRHFDGSIKSSPVKNILFDMEKTLVVKTPVAGDMLLLETRVDGKLSIVSADGKQLITSQATALDRCELSIAHLPAGVYYVVLRSGDFEVTEPFTKL